MARRKHSELKRSRPKRNPIRRFYLVCEGKNTEPDYFAELQKVVHSTQVRIIPIPEAGDPSAITRIAIEKATELGLVPRSRKKLNSFEEGDEVWVVFDRDTHTHYDEPKAQCRQKNVGVAYSDPCFEHWLNLHYGPSDAPCDGDQAQRQLERLCTGYSRRAGKTANFADLMENLDEAERRAERQMVDREDESNVEGNPSTSVFQLTRAIKKAASESS